MPNGVVPRDSVSTLVERARDNGLPGSRVGVFASLAPPWFGVTVIDRAGRGA
jgi:hypothetical protein